MPSTYIDYSGYWKCPICHATNYIDPDTIDLDQPNNLTCENCNNTVEVEL